jgi:hypothetical protein
MTLSGESDSDHDDSDKSVEKNDNFMAVTASVKSGGESSEYAPPNLRVYLRMILMMRMTWKLIITQRFWKNASMLC